LVLPKYFHVSSCKLVSKEFEDAKSKLGSLKEDPGNEAKLKLYALFKQATVGACNAPKPGMMDFVGKAKWTAWNNLGNISQKDAEANYIALINELTKGATVETKQDENKASSDSGAKFKEILTSIEHGSVYRIVLNRPQKKNAINAQMYLDLRQALKEADANPNIKFCLITGSGDFYCSGNDLSNFTENMGSKSIQEFAKECRDFLHAFVEDFIDFSKPIVGVVNGPAVGISFTLLGLFDLVIANEKATFQAPFTKLGQSPEGCSSYKFPLLMGPNKAAEVLLFNRKLTAQEAFERNIVTEVVPNINFQSEVARKIEEFSKLPYQSLTTSRKLIRDAEKAKLKEVNTRECDLIMERWCSEEFMQAIMNFFSRK